MDEDTDERWSPQMLVALAHKDDPEDEVRAALYEELRRIRPDAARELGPHEEVRWLVERLDRYAPDGWYFGLKRGKYGFWPVPGM